MSIRNSNNRFGFFGLFIHWAMALLMVAGFVSGQIMDGAPKGPEKLSVLGWHFLIGGSILALVVLRILWRRMDPPPVLPSTVPAWEVKLSWLVHMVLYGVMLALPITGFLAATSLPVAIPLPGLFDAAPLFPSEGLHDGSGELHETLVGIMMFSLALHVIGAIWHRYIRKDGVTERMIPFMGQTQS